MHGGQCDGLCIGGKVGSSGLEPVTLSLYLNALPAEQIA